MVSVCDLTDPHTEDKERQKGGSRSRLAGGGSHKKGNSQTQLAVGGCKTSRPPHMLTSNFIGGLNWVQSRVPPDGPATHCPLMTVFWKTAPTVGTGQNIRSKDRKG